MALPVLDGNQSATTLSSVVTGGEHIVAHSVVCLGSTAIANITNAVSGSVVSISNFPSTQTVAGTVTANFVTNPSYEDSGGTRALLTQVGGFDSINGRTNPIRVDEDGEALWVKVTNEISGTVTANVGGIASGVTIPVRLFAEREGTAPTGEDTLVVCNSNGRLLVDATAAGTSVVNYDGEAFVRVKMTNASSVTIGSLPSGSLTTRFGSVTTANTAQITSAVTNTNRKYLLAQNISAGTVTIGIGFSPTTTQGIQLTAGGGLTCDAFCPTGAVYWLGAVTGAAFTILEG